MPPRAGTKKPDVREKSKEELETNEDTAESEEIPMEKPKPVKEPAKKAAAKKPPAKKAKGGKKRKADSESDDDVDHDYLDSVRTSANRKTTLTATDKDGKQVEVPVGTFPPGGIRLGLSRNSRPRAPLHPGARVY